jgi:hypothetical protein
MPKIHDPERQARIEATLRSGIDQAAANLAAAPPDDDDIPFDADPPKPMPLSRGTAPAKAKAKVPAPRAAASSFAYFEDEDNHQAQLIGTRIQLIGGRFVAPRDNTTLDTADASFLAVGIARAWVHFADGRPDRTISYTSREDRPTREDLDPPPPKDTTKEPDSWADTCYLFLRDCNSDEEYTFTSSGKWGRGRVNKLAGRILERQQRDPGVLPLIQLSAEKKAGAKPGQSFWVPVFNVVGWQLASGQVV